MPDIVQHILVLALVAGCLAWVLRGVWKTFSLKRGGVGTCCKNGCEARNPSAPRTVFIPADVLTRKRN